MHIFNKHSYAEPNRYHIIDDKLFPNFCQQFTHRSNEMVFQNETAPFYIEKLLHILLCFEYITCWFRCYFFGDFTDRKDRKH